MNRSCLNLNMSPENQSKWPVNAPCIYFVPGYVLCYPAIFAINRLQPIGSKARVTRRMFIEFLRIIRSQFAKNLNTNLTLQLKRSDNLNLPKLIKLVPNRTCLSPKSKAIPTQAWIQNAWWRDIPGPRLMRRGILQPYQPRDVASLSQSPTWQAHQKADWSHLFWR